jgi:hypothetical protein
MAASKIQTGCQPEALIQIRLLPTAWLYSQFRAGTLTLDTGLGSYFDADRLANAGELQNAIWFLEDEGGQNNGYVALAESALGTDLAGIKADSNGAYDVVALNLFTPMATWLRISWRLFPSPRRLFSAWLGGLGLYPTLYPKPTFLIQRNIQCATKSATTFICWRRNQGV